MNSNQNLTLLFDRYLQGKMSYQDQKKFEEKLASDPEFAQNFKLHKEVDASILAEDIEAFRAKLNIIQNENIDSIIEEVPMEVIPKLDYELDEAILEEDVIALREQLDKIHFSVEEEVNIPGYQQIDHAIIQQNGMKLHQELLEFDENRDENHQMTTKERIESDIDRAIMQTDVIELRDRLEKIGSRISSNSGKVVTMGTRRIKIMYSAAAVLVVAFASTIFLSSMVGPMPSEKAYNKYFKPYSTLSEKRGGSPEKGADAIAKAALDFYNESNWTRAYNFYDYLSEYQPLEAMQSMFQAVAALQINMLDESEEILKGILNSNEFIYKPDAEWYLAMLYLKRHNPEDALEMLSTIANEPKNKHANQAKKLITKGVK